MYCIAQETETLQRTLPAHVLAQLLCFTSSTVPQRYYERLSLGDLLNTKYCL